MRVSCASPGANAQPLTGLESEMKIRDVESLFTRSSVAKSQPALARAARLGPNSLSQSGAGKRTADRDLRRTQRLAGVRPRGSLQQPDLPRYGREEPKVKLPLRPLQ